LECSGSDYFVTDLGSANGTYLNGIQLEPQVPARLRPADEVSFGPSENPATKFRIKLRHESLADGGHGQYVRKRSEAKEGEAREAAIASS